MTQVAWQGAGQRKWTGAARTDASGAGSGGAIAPSGPMSPAGLADDSGAQSGTQHAQRTGEHARTGGEVILDLQHISLAFGGVPITRKALGSALSTVKLQGLIRVRPDSFQKQI